MNPLLCLTKLNAKTQNFTPTVDGMSGHTQADIAHLVGMAKRDLTSPGPGLLLEVKWVHDRNRVRPLVAELALRMKQALYDERWQLSSDEQIIRMAILALRQGEAIRFAINAPALPYGQPCACAGEPDCYEPGIERCTRCKGTGIKFSRKTGDWVRCSLCQGRAGRVWKPAHQAEFCLIEKGSWLRLWQWRFRYLSAILGHWHGEAVEALMRYM